MFLTTIKQPGVFQEAIPPVPMAKYAHFVVLRETESFALFQTDQQLNFAKVREGRTQEGQAISRIVLFKRKQTTPERLTGRELLRRYGLTSIVRDTPTYCEYNSERFCKVCPDCIYYGFAIGNEGSERSKVMVDSAFSLSNYDESHQSLTFNAPYEHGTMSQGGETRSSFGEQDHVLPQIFFPSVVTVRDPTEAEFIYVLNNILRTKRYGAQTTRTGSLENHLVGVIFADGEIFSNLKLTQMLYEKLPKGLDGKPEKGPYPSGLLKQEVENLLDELLKEDRVSSYKLVGPELAALVEEVGGLVSNEARLQEVLRQAYAESSTYARTYGAKADKKSGGKGKGKGDKAVTGEEQ